MSWPAGLTRFPVSDKTSGCCSFRLFVVVLPPTRVLGPPLRCLVVFSGDGMVKAAADVLVAMGGASFDLFAALRAMAGDVCGRGGLRSELERVSVLAGWLRENAQEKERERMDIRSCAECSLRRSGVQL